MTAKARTKEREMKTKKKTAKKKNYIWYAENDGCDGAFLYRKPMGMASETGICVDWWKRAGGPKLPDHKDDCELLTTFEQLRCSCGPKRTKVKLKIEVV